MKRRIFLIFLVLAVCFIYSGITAGSASADAILLPWVIQDNDVSTIVSVVNTAQGNSVFPEQLHYQYWYKPDTTNAPGDSCNYISFKRQTSRDDKVSFDTAGNINDGKALFNDPGAGLFTYGDKSFKLNVASPRRAFLLIDNNTPSFVDAGTNDDATLHGEAFVIDNANGVTFGYTAYNARYTEEATGQNQQVFFSDGLDSQGEVLGATEEAKTTLLPPTYHTTEFFVTPIGTSGQRTFTPSAEIQLCAQPDGSGGCNEGGIFDNDEQTIDFEKIVSVVCTGRLSLMDMMTEASYNHLLSTGGGGWTYITTENDAVIGKLEVSNSKTLFGKGTKLKNMHNSDNFTWIRSGDNTTSPLP